MKEKEDGNISSAETTLLQLSEALKTVANVAAVYAKEIKRTNQATQGVKGFLAVKNTLSYKITKGIDSIVDSLESEYVEGTGATMAPDFSQFDSEE